MIPIELKIKGLYSYVDEQVIDFSKLLEAGLFGIFGKVGSGKSSILEAMALAIYGRTERFLITGDNRYYNMLNLKASEATIHFKFSAGAENTSYVAQLKLTRNRNNFEDVKLANHDFYREEAGVLVPITKSEMEDAVGISYENFKRTIIIPQGQFKEFLELGPAERTKMLKELFGLQRFDLSAKVSILDAQNKEKLYLLEGELRGFETVSLESIHQFEEELKTVLADFNVIKDTAEAQDKAIKLLEQLQQNFEKLASVREQLTFLEAQEILDVKQEQRIAEFERVKLAYSNLFDAANDSAAKHKESQQLLEELSQHVETEQLVLTGVSVQLATLEIEKGFSASKKKKAEELEKLAVLFSEREKEVQQQKELTVLTDKNSELVAKKSECIATKKSLEDQIIEAEKQHIPAEKLFALKMWFEQLDANSKQENILLEKEKGLIECIQNVDLQMINERNSVFPSFFKLLPEPFDAVSLDLHYGIFKEMLTKALNTQRAAQTQLKIQEELQRFAIDLEEGKPCDLCGSLHHPKPLEWSHSGEILEQTSKNIQKAEEELSAFEKLRSRLSDNLTKKESFSTQKESVLKEKYTLEQEKLIYLTSSPDSSYSDLDKLKFEVNLSAVQASEKRVEEYKKSLLTISEENEKLLLALQELEQRINQKNIQLATIQGVLALRRTEVTELSEAVYLNSSTAEIEVEKETLLREIETNERQITDQMLKKGTLEILLAELGGKFTFQSNEVQNIAKTEKKINADIELKLANEGKTRIEINAILKQELDVDNLRKEITANRTKLNESKGEKNALEKLVAGEIPIDAAAYQLQLEKYEKTKEKLVSLTESKGKLESVLQNLHENLAKKATLVQDFEALKVRAIDIGTLKKMFIGNGFVEFVSRRYLQNVVALANVRFQKMVRQKFKLELSAKGDFLVRDFLNNGKTRSLKSLSGGQTFQAAFCLALALSENIQRNAGVEQHFFFLDEGFGTLDSENLQIVFETLKTLRSENRIVGLISHVEELQQEMDVFLKIENDPDNGTRVYESWK
jgi:exonuclease SbcC